MWIERKLATLIKSDFYKSKILLIIGARQVGKTTLIENTIKYFCAKEKLYIKTFNCDEITDREMLNPQNINLLKKEIADSKIIFIDEGQKVENIGETLKILVEKFKKEKQIIVTGSSTFNLLDKTSEPLTGRKLVYQLYPLSFEEIFVNKSFFQIQKELENLLVYGSYPEITTLNTSQDKIKLLKEISGSYLYKDILEFQNIKNSNLIFSLLKALALQIGSEVSYNELSNLLGIDKATVERYIDLLEKNFIIFRLSPFTTKKRREISKMKKIFFYDLGIRNAIINNFNMLDSRGDAGLLFENYMIVERMKYREYNNIYANQYFWRTYDGSEVDLIEERDGKLYGFEFKWNKKNTRIPQKWLSYPKSSFEVISKDNIDGFLT